MHLQAALHRAPAPSRRMLRPVCAAGSPPAVHVQHFAIRSLLHLGIEKVEQCRFRQRPVGLQEARLKLDEVLAAKGNDVAKVRPPVAGCAPVWRGCWVGALLRAVLAVQPG